MRGLLRHQHRSQHRFRGPAQGDDAVILQQNDKHEAVHATIHVGLRVFANDPGEGNTRVRIRHKHRRHVATNNLIRNHAFGGKFPGARRAEEGRHRGGVRVTDIFHTGKCQQPRVKESFD